MSVVARKLVATRLSSDFRNCTSIVSDSIPLPIRPSQLLVKNFFVGINASDVNFSAGKYMPSIKPPFDVGFEAIGQVVDVGEKTTLAKNSFVVYTAYGAFAELKVVPEKHCVAIPKPSVEYLPLLVSGLTASIALERVGEMKKGETVLVTAAAGGTGLFAVQLAKLAGNHVIGTVSSQEKVEFLKSLGCDRVVNYKKENLDEVLSKEYPNGVDIVYESVGGEMFNVCVNHLAVKGRLIVIGSISGYKDGSSWRSSNDNDQRSAPLASKLLTKSSSIRGFFLNHFASDRPQHLERLVRLCQEKKLRSVVDQASSSFRGLEAIADAVDHLFAGRNTGKVFVTLDQQAKL